MYIRNYLHAPPDPTYSMILRCWKQTLSLILYCSTAHSAQGIPEEPVEQSKPDPHPPPPSFTSAEQLYWCDGDTDIVEVSALDGSNRQTVTGSPDGYCSGLTLDADYLYLLDFGVE